MVADHPLLSLSETDNQAHGEVTERTLQTDSKY